MNGRITTSIETEKKIIELQKVLRLSTKAAVMRIALGISLNIKTDPRENINSQDHNGATYQIITITGEKTNLYKALITEHSRIYRMKDEEFLELVVAHISRGIEMLYTEYQLKGNYTKLIDYIFSFMEG